jgi:hypothetical protein
MTAATAAHSNATPSGGKYHKDGWHRTPGRELLPSLPLLLLPLRPL